MYINSAACASAFITSKVLLILNRNRIRGSGAQLVLATSEAGLQRMDVVLDIQLSAFLHFSFARLLVYNPANDSVSAPLRDLSFLSSNVFSPLVWVGDSAQVPIIYLVAGTGCLVFGRGDEKK